MDFKESILKLSDDIRKDRGYVRLEEATKHAFILPMITALGYDIHNPIEVVPEPRCDINSSGANKVDYVIMRDGEEVVLIEAKPRKENIQLSRHHAQLKEYFHASDARFGVLTNGIEYLFYADTVKDNVMDDRPFMVLDMLKLSDDDIERLKIFHKNYFNGGAIRERLYIRKILNHYPNDPFLKKEIEDYIHNTGREPVKITRPTKQKTDNAKNDIPAYGMEAFDIVSKILTAEMDVSNLGIKSNDDGGHCVIHLGKSQLDWIFRVHPVRGVAFYEGNNRKPRSEIMSPEEVIKNKARLIDGLKYRQQEMTGKTQH